MSRVIHRFFTLGCASGSSDATPEAERGRHRGKVPKVKFDVPLVQVYAKDNDIPQPLIDLIVYVAKEGVTAPAVFRRPGNRSDVNKIAKRMSEGRFVHWQSFNYYTLSSVIKRFLLDIPGGIFGPELEEDLLTTLKYDHPLRQFDVVNEAINKLPGPTQHLITLLFGMWFRIANHSEFHGMSAESIAKSVTGSVFHSCSMDPQKVYNAAKVVELMIENYGVANMFGQANIQYFVDTTNTRIQVTERFKYEYHYPPACLIPREEALRPFAIIMQNEAKKQGFDLKKNEVTADQYFGVPKHKLDSAHDSEDLGIVNIPSRVPQSEPCNTRGLKKTASLSAPEVNAKRREDRQRLHTADPRAFSKSMSRFDTVKLMQLQRMRKRSDWFLTHSQRHNSLTSDGADRSSRGTSVDKTMSDTASIASENGSVFDDPNRGFTPTSEPTKSPCHINKELTAAPSSHSSASSALAEEVAYKYFMVERFYTPRVTDPHSPMIKREGQSSDR